MSNLTKHIITVFIVGMMSISFAAKAGVSDYQVYSDPKGQLYLEAPKRFVLITAEISIPLLIAKKYGFLKIVRSGASWTVEALSAEQWAGLSLSPGHSSVSAAQVYGDSSVMLLMINQNVPALLIGGFDSSPTLITVNTDGSVYVGPKVTYLHTDILGSVVAETDESGAVKKTTDYKPFGESKDN